MFESNLDLCLTIGILCLAPFCPRPLLAIADAFIEASRASLVAEHKKDNTFSFSRAFMTELPEAYSDHRHWFNDWVKMMF
jgi:hypothetical protein